MSDTEFLRNQIEELEFQLRQRESDLETYRTELVKANLELERLIINVTNQLDVATKIQKLLTPTEYPNISGFEFSSKFVPGGKMGGDYFDIFELDDKMKFGVMLASCSGYSMSALLLSVLLKFTGISEAKKGGGTLSLVNGIMQDLQSGMMEPDLVSLFFAVIDRRTYEMEYICIGDLACLVVEGENGKIRKLEKHGPSISPKLNFEVTTSLIDLNSKDRLVLGSQGLIEARGVESESFGLERIYKAIVDAPRTSVHDMRNEILFKLKEHRDSEEVDRDVTVLVAEVKDRVIKLADRK